MSSNSDHTGSSEKEHTQENISEFVGSANTSLAPGSPHVDHSPNTVDPNGAAAYIRRSIDEDESSSIAEQIASLKQLAEEQELSLVEEPIVDKGETGTDFDRPGIKKVAYLAERGEISHLLVDDISRIGRSAPETLSFISRMEADHGVTIMTPTGTLDISQVEELTQAVMQTLIAHVATHYRTKASLRSRVASFVKNRDWKSWYNTVPVGYTLTGEGWLQVSSEEVDVVEAIFDQFLDKESYAETARYIKDHYASRLNKTIDAYRVKSTIQNPVYIGKPSVEIESDKLNDNEQTVDDPNLQIIGEDTYKAAQKVATKINRRYSNHNHGKDNIDPDTAAHRFGLFAASQSSPVLEVICPDCEGRMRCNGQRDLEGGLNAHLYQCTNAECGTQRKWPYLSELREMRNRSDSWDRSDHESNEDVDEDTS